MIEIGGGDLDGVTAEGHHEIDLVVEQDGAEEGETEPFAIRLELAPLALRQGAAAQNVVEWFGDRFGLAGGEVDQNVVAKGKRPVRHQSIRVDDLEFDGVGACLRSM